jgi:hypothetical protein
MSGVEIVVTGDTEGSVIVTARNCAGSIDEGGLEGRAPATPGPATRADAAMSAAIATMSLVRTMRVHHTRVLRNGFFPSPRHG